MLTQVACTVPQAGIYREAGEGVFGREGLIGERCGGG